MRSLEFRECNGTSSIGNICFPELTNRKNHFSQQFYLHHRIGFLRNNVGCALRAVSSAKGDICVEFAIGIRVGPVFHGINWTKVFKHAGKI